MDEIENEAENYLSNELEVEEKSPQYYENKYELVTRVAFLCGVPDKHFSQESSNFLPKVFETLKKNDKAFLVRSLCLLRNSLEHNYKLINDAMTHDTSNLSDVSGEIKNRIYEFLDNSYKSILIVDCENADPYSLCAMFNCIDDNQADKISKIILFDDPKASTGWNFFEQHVNIQLEKIEHIVIKRVLD